MGKILFISEKPKVTRELLKSPRFKNSKKIEGNEPFIGYYENEKYVHTWAVGHLLELFNPEDHEPGRKDFSFDVLPNIFPLRYKPKHELQAQLDTIVRLLNRSDIEVVVNACDIDKEGEIIFREIYEYSGCTKPILRLLLSNYESSEVEASLNKLEKGEDFDTLAAAGKLRQYLDHLLGDTITRASTVKLANKQFLLSGGRIQLCLLNEIRRRELSVEQYRPQTLYTLMVDTGFLTSYKTEGQVLNPRPLKSLMERLKDSSLTVTSFGNKESKKHAPNLYNLTDLYQDCIKKLNIPSPKAKKAIQTLYEEGYISYPRTGFQTLAFFNGRVCSNCYTSIKGNIHFF